MRRCRGDVKYRKSLKEACARAIVSPINNSDTLYLVVLSLTLRDSTRPSETQSKGPPLHLIECIFEIAIPSGQAAGWNFIQPASGIGRFAQGVSIFLTPTVSTTSGNNGVAQNRRTP